MAPSIRERLDKAVGTDRLVRVLRSSRPGYTIDGFVLQVGTRWALLAATTEGGYFDGYRAIRIADIESVKRDRSFQARFAQTRPAWPPRPPHTARPIDLDGTRRLLTTLLQPGHLVGIERDGRVDATWIGVPHDLDQRWLYLWQVTPKATWQKEPLGYALKTITTVVLDDRYQVALAQMVPDRPADAGDNWPPPDRPKS